MMQLSDSSPSTSWTSLTQKPRTKAAPLKLPRISQRNAVVEGPRAAKTRRQPPTLLTRPRPCLLSRVSAVVLPSLKPTRRVNLHQRDPVVVRLRTLGPPLLMVARELLSVAKLLQRRPQRENLGDRKRRPRNSFGLRPLRNIFPRLLIPRS